MSPTANKLITAAWYAIIASTVVVGATTLDKRDDIEGTFTNTGVIEIFAVRHYNDRAVEICDWIRRGERAFTIFTRDDLVTLIMPEYFYGLPPEVEETIRAKIETDCPERG